MVFARNVKCLFIQKKNLKIVNDLDHQYCPYEHADYVIAGHT